MPPLKDLTGMKFGQLTVLERAEKTAYGQYQWLCQCECGNKTVVVGQNLRTNSTKSCGCGKYGKGLFPSFRAESKHKRIYRIWRGMLHRCYNPNYSAYQNWGGRGIEVCDEWKKDFYSFLAWSMGNGYQEHLSIDRVDNNGNYCPENCRWADNQTQGANKRGVHLITHKGVTKTLMDWSRHSAIPYDELRMRIKYGWPVERALTEPVKKNKK